MVAASEPVAVLHVKRFTHAAGVVWECSLPASAAEVRSPANPKREGARLRTGSRSTAWI